LFLHFIHRDADGGVIMIAIERIFLAAEEPVTKLTSPSQSIREWRTASLICDGNDYFHFGRNNQNTKEHRLWSEQPA
jgi:hypothetical protein